VFNVRRDALSPMALSQMEYWKNGILEYPNNGFVGIFPD